MKRGTSTKRTVPEGSSTSRSGTHCPRGGGGGSRSVTIANSRQEQQRELGSCEPAEVHMRNKKTHTKQLPPPKFLRGLVRAVTDRSDVVAFKDGSVTVKDHAVLVSEVLPKFFKASTTLKSFLRQLNYFAFRKIDGKGAMQPGVFHNATLEGKKADAIISLKRRQVVKSDQEAATTVNSESARLPRSTGSSVFNHEAAVASAFAALVTSGSRAHNTRVPPPPTTRSAYTSSTLLPPSSMIIDARSGVAVASTNGNIRGYASSPRALATGKNDRDIAIRHDWSSFDARGNGSTTDANRLTPVPFAAREGSGTVDMSGSDMSGSRDGNGGGSSDLSSNSDLNLEASAAKRKLGEHFEGGAVAKERLQSKRVCRYLGRYYSNPTGLRGNGSHRGGVGGDSGGSTCAASEEAPPQLLGLATTKVQQHPCARAHLGVQGLGRENRSSFVFGYDHGRDGGHTGAPPSSRKSVFSAVLPLSGLAWRVQPVTPCPGLIAFAEPPPPGLQSGCGLGQEMVMAAPAGRSPGMGGFLRGTCTKLGFSTDPDRFPAPDKVGSITPAVGRGTCIKSTIGGVGGGGGGLCSEVRGNTISPFGAEAVFGPFCAVEGDVSPDCLDECFMRERVSSAPSQENLIEPGNGGSDFGVGLFHDYSC